LKGPEPTARSSAAVTLLHKVLDVQVLVYGLTVGILAVVAGALVDRSGSLLVTATIAVVGSLLGDPLLKRLLPVPPSPDPARYS
jgi:hypothetical protein